MKNCQRQIKAVFGESLKKAMPPDLPPLEPIVALSNPKFGGDYQCNSAMSIYKQFGKEKGWSSPMSIGELISANLETDMFEDVTVSKQGFVTAKLSSSWLSKELKAVIKGDSTGTTGGSDDLLNIDLQGSKHLVVSVDFSSPNIAKEMHVGHLRSTIIGECTSRLLEYCGHTVNRINHVGDWGTQFGMLIEYMKEIQVGGCSSESASVLAAKKGDSAGNDGAACGTDDLGDLQNFYKASKQRFDEDPEFKKRAQRNVVELQSGEPGAVKVWKEICAISRREFQKLYDRLGVRLEERGESFYNDMIPGIVQELTATGLITVSDGAQCLFTEGSQVPLIVVKSDGGYGYDSTDIAAVRHRLLELHSDWVIYITDLGQEEHFTKLFAAAKAAGWHKPPATRLDHMGFGVVQGEDGKKFKTRSGDVVKLIDLLDEAASRALVEIKTRRASAETDTSDLGGVEMTQDEMTKVAESIGYSAVKYFDLKQNRTTNYRFSFDKMLDAKGNTAVYMLYAYARICAIFRKCGVKQEDLNSDDLQIQEEPERLLAVMIIRLPEVIELILSDLHVHRLAEYMYDITETFTNFYQKCRVLGVPQQSSRLVLCELTRKVLQVCFFLLGITPLERI